MIFYRYEKSDGGGPYFTRDGHQRSGNIVSNDDTLDGALTIEELNKWFIGKENIIEDCRIIKYDGELIKLYESGDGIFKKSTAKRIGIVSKYIPKSLDEFSSFMIKLENEGILKGWTEFIQA